MFFVLNQEYPQWQNISVLGWLEIMADLEHRQLPWGRRKCTECLQKRVQILFALFQGSEFWMFSFFKWSFFPYYLSRTESKKGHANPLRRAKNIFILFGGHPVMLPNKYISDETLSSRGTSFQGRWTGRTERTDGMTRSRRRRTSRTLSPEWCYAGDWTSKMEETKTLTFVCLFHQENNQRCLLIVSCHNKTLEKRK